MQTHSHPTVTGETISASMRTKAADGYAIGAVKVGYLPYRTNASFGVEQVPDPRLTPIIQEAFRMAANGSSVRSVTAWLSTHDVKSSHGKPVSVATVQRLLTDPFYVGLVKDAAGKYVAGRHEALVDQQTFAQVQRQLIAKRCRPYKTN